MPPIVRFRNPIEKRVPSDVLDPELPVCEALQGRICSMRVKVLAIRVILGIVFAVLLGRVFFPQSGPALTGGIALMLVFFAYVLEAVHSRRDGD